jgi:hypothetical protein
MGHGSRKKARASPWGDPRAMRDHAKTLMGMQLARQLTAKKFRAGGAWNELAIRRIHPIINPLPEDRLSFIAPP